MITLAAAAAMDALVFNPTWFSGGLGGRNVPSPTLFGLNLGISSGNSYPRVIFGVLILIIVTLVALSVARMRSSATGRMLIAVRSNERAAAAAGIRVAPAKLFAFALSAFIAGLGGGLLGYLQGTVSAPTFATFTSINLLAIAYVAGIGRIAGAVFAGVMMSANGFFVNLLNEHISIGQYQTIVAGVALALTAIKNPDGVASEVADGSRGPGRWAALARDRVLPVRWFPQTASAAQLDAAPSLAAQPPPARTARGSGARRAPTPLTAPFQLRGRHFAAVLSAAKLHPRSAGASCRGCRLPGPGCRGPRSSPPRGCAARRSARSRPRPRRRGAGKTRMGRAARRLPRRSSRW